MIASKIMSIKTDSDANIKIAKRLSPCARLVKLRKVLIAIVIVNRMKKLVDYARNPDE